MGRGRWYAIAVLGSLMTAGMVAWRTWRLTSLVQFDPVAAVIPLTGLAVSVAALRLAVRAQKKADTDVAGVAGRLAVAVKNEESKARRQLLDDHDRSIDVQFSLQRAAAHRASGASKSGTLKEIVDYYRQLQPQRMVITGMAGSGKTVLAVELILGLLNGRDQDAPVPVRMSAAMLDTSLPPGSAVQNWLVGHLNKTYRLPEAAARHLVAARMVLPVIDGLDEMDATEEPGYASRAGQVIRACNAYLDGRQKAAMVLTCRIGQYEALGQANEWVHDAAQVRLRPVGLPTARSFLTRRVTDKDRWQPVLDAMRRSGNGPLASALSTPWRLTLAAAVYDWRDPATGGYLRDPADLASPGLETEDKIRDHLLALFIPAAVTVQGRRYPPSNVHHWLGVLAGYLDANTPSSATRPARVIAKRTLPGTDLVLHEMWPLAGPRMPRAITSGLMAVIWLTAAAWVFTRMPISSLPRQVALAVGTIAAIVTVIYAGTAWPRPNRINLRQLKTSQGRRQLAGALVVGLVVGLTFGLTFGFGFGFGLGFGFGFGLVAGLGAALVAGLLLDPGEYSVTQPREIIRANLLAGAGTGLVAGLVAGLVTAFVVALMVALMLNPGEYSVMQPGQIIRANLFAGLGTGLVGLLTGGLAGGLGFGLLGWRYITLLLCTRRWSSHWLPWRLGSFLHWCSGAGLIRAAGIGYQFRHRELQDYLARNPTVTHSHVTPEQLDSRSVRWSDRHAVLSPQTTQATSRSAPA